MIVKGEDKNRNTWKLAKIIRLIIGTDGVVRENGKGKAAWSDRCN